MVKQSEILELVDVEYLTTEQIAQIYDKQTNYEEYMELKQGNLIK